MSSNANGDARYIIGVDLGTTNTVVAYVDLDAAGENGRRIEHFEVPQLVAPGELGRAPMLPSFLYLPGPHDLPGGSLALPWDATRGYAVGVLAQEQGARVPGRLAASAKSWLSHGGVDRTADILPWQAPHEVKQVSPVEASARYLRHVREAWNEEMARGNDEHRFERQRVVLTVPASFDEVARELTVEAARRAGIPDFVLLEEPLAAFYAWLDARAADGESEEAVSREDIQDGALVLVCDVGGGTSDFSIIRARRERGEDEVRFERLAVGEHLMLGGDNMDHALGRKVETEIAGEAGALDPQRWQQLVEGCRRAKESLLGDDAPEEEQVSVAARGSRLIGGTLTGTLRRDDVEQLVLEGFFPEASLDDPLQGARRTGLTELGLPYEPDAAITRHLAAFWRRFLPLLREETDREAPRPDYLLFNGGVFTPEVLRERLRRIVGGWFAEGWAPRELSGVRRDLAVARGAAYYGLVRRGEAARVGSGSARAYYVAVAAGKDGADEEKQPAMCLVPRGAEEGFSARLEKMPVEALTNQPVTFHLFSSISRTGDAFGEVVTLSDDEAQALPPIRTVLRFGRKGIARALPVELGVRLTEVGTLELFCQSVQTEHRWALAFDVRQEADALPEDGEADPSETLDLEQIEAAQDALRDAFENGETPPGEALWEALEEKLDAPRTEWPLPALRKLSDALLKLEHDASPEHERAWLDLLGYALRPGYGDAVDDWRLREAWKTYMSGLAFPKETENQLAWWRFWRRIGGGLPAKKQAQVYYDARAQIQHKVRTRKRHPLYPQRLSDEEKQAAWKTLATFERLPSDVRGALGQIVIEQFQKKPSVSMLWALSRLGTRQPLYGPLDSLVPAEEAGGWLKTLLGFKLPRQEAVAFTLVHLTRRTGDRGRDVPEGVRQQVVGELRRHEESEKLLAPVQSAGAEVPPEAEAWLIGEPLPAAGDAAALPERIGIAYAGEEGA